MSADADAMLRDAVLLERAGRITEAISVYERALTRRPDRADSWYNLALLQRKARRYEAALASYRQALDHGVSQPEEVHFHRGVIHEDLRRGADAEAEWIAAITLNPRHVPALLKLARLDESRGRRHQARARYERILEIDPLCQLALARLAELASVAEPADPLIGQLRAALARSDTNAAEAASLGFALGRLLDASGAYEDAFEAYREANRQSRASAGPDHAVYDRQAHERCVDELITAFPAARGDLSPTDSAVKPIFICGMYRSGSRLTEQLLAAHGRVVAGGENDLLNALARTELQPYPSSMTHSTADSLAEVADWYLRSLAGLFPGARYVTDKRPDNFLHIGLIKTLFPAARIVHTVRNPLDNCLSVYFLHLDHGVSYAFDLLDIAHYYRQYRRLMAHWGALYGPDILDFDYDAYVREPRASAQRLFEFCGLDHGEDAREVAARGATDTLSVSDALRPVYQSSSGRWRNYARQLGPLEAALADFTTGQADRGSGRDV